MGEYFYIGSYMIVPASFPLPAWNLDRLCAIGFFWIFFSSGFAPLSAAEATIPIWPEPLHTKLGLQQTEVPTITPYLPKKGNGAAMLLIPGGSYAGIYEGQAAPFALWLNEQGIAAFVLRYRLGRRGYRYPAQLQDAVRAMRLIRGQASSWKVDSARVGAMGFSAGGHLVSTLLTRPEDGEVSASDEYDAGSPRPDIAILCYPVISMETAPHMGSRNNLIGTAPDAELVRKTSSEQQVRSGLPPCFVWHTVEDKMVSVGHSLLFATALREHHVPYELHLYQHGDHGTGLMGTNHPWKQDLLFWLKGLKFIE